jgi:hypothetical protein
MTNDTEPHAVAAALILGPGLCEELTSRHRIIQNEKLTHAKPCLIFPPLSAGPGYPDSESGSKDVNSSCTTGPFISGADARLLRERSRPN